MIRHTTLFLYAMPLTACAINHGPRPLDQRQRRERHAGGAVRPRMFEGHSDEAGRPRARAGQLRSQTLAVSTTTTCNPTLANLQSVQGFPSPTAWDLAGRAITEIAPCFPSPLYEG